MPNTLTLAQVILDILDRDEPMTMKDIQYTFQSLTGRLPTETELLSMHPDSIETCREYLNSRDDY